MQQAGGCLGETRWLERMASAKARGLCAPGREASVAAVESAEEKARGREGGEEPVEKEERIDWVQPCKPVQRTLFSLSEDMKMLAAPEPHHAT